MTATVEPPFIVALNLTRRCNLACEHCYLDAGTRLDGENGELTTDEVKALIDDIARLSEETMVVFTGGEPLLRRDLDDLVAHAASRGLMPVLGTNGVLITDDRAARLRQAGVQGVGISIDSLDPDFHDGFRGAPGSWIKSMSAIDIEVAPSLGNSPEFAYSVNLPELSFRNNRAPLAKPVTNRSLSPSPSTSAISAPVEYCLGQAAPDSAVTSLKLQLPKLRYRRLSTCSPQK